ncbi:MAG: FRG domain-containing protein [Phycisphaeraceae bacterium]|nr:FRG domain-containing protein [Phycisphaeraceae bacterium]
MLPKVFRAEVRLGRSADYESDMCWRFKLAAPPRHANCPSVGDHGSWLSLMQHYGLPTRLLDWTGSLLTAMYFAVEDCSHDDKDGAIWLLSPGKLNESMSGQAGRVRMMHDTDVDKLLGDAFNYKNNSEVVYPVLPTECDARMMMQLSRFTLHGSASKLCERPDAGDFVAQIIIPHEMKAGLRELATMLGARASVLFPDLGALARELAVSMNPIAPLDRAAATKPTKAAIAAVPSENGVVRDAGGG